MTRVWWPGRGEEPQGCAFCQQWLHRGQKPTDVKSKAVKRPCSGPDSDNDSFWFDLSIDKDQLGPFPADWNVDEGGSKSLGDDDLEEAIRLSLEDADRVSSMAVIVEVPEDEPVKDKLGSGPGKGKGVSAGERSAGFAEYLRMMEQKKTTAGPSGTKAAKSEKANRKEKALGNKVPHSAASQREKAPRDGVKETRATCLTRNATSA